MNIYLAHSTNINFKQNLYEPIRKSSLNNEHNFVLPHENSDTVFNSKDFLKHNCDLLIAEVSEPSTGLGIELGWADTFGIPIFCIYRKGSNVSSSLKLVSNSFIEYSNKELILAIQKTISKINN